MKERKEWVVIGEEHGVLILKDKSGLEAKISKALLPTWEDNIKKGHTLVVYYDEKKEVVVFYHTIYSSYIASLG